MLLVPLLLSESSSFRSPSRGGLSHVSLQPPPQVSPEPSPTLNEQLYSNASHQQRSTSSISSSSASHARIRPGVNLGSEALGRIDPAVPTRDATGVPAAGVPSGVGRAIDVVGLDPCDVDARDGNGRRLDADCAREASGEWTRLACISIFGSQ